MRVKRLKHCKKHIAFYKTQFGFHEPYQVLVDLTFCQHALTCKINIKEQVANYFGAETQLFTTKCILEEGKLLGPQLGGALHICKQYKLRKCGHKEAMTAQQCIEDMIGESNPLHFFVASQDHELQLKLRRIPGVPILRIHYHALVLEKPHGQSKREADSIGVAKCGITEAEQERIRELKKKHNIKEVKEKLPREKKVKGVNPLAMKKKKKKDVIVGKKTKDSTKTRNRKKKKIAQHVFEHLKEQNVKT